MHNPLFRIEVLHNVVLVISYSMQERGNLFHGHYSRAEPFKKYHRSFKTISSCHTSITRRGAAFYQKMHFFCQKSFEGNLGTLCLKISQEVSSSEASYVLKNNILWQNQYWNIGTILAIFGVKIQIFEK